MLSHCKNNAFQCKIKDICIPSSSRGVLDLALARSPENYQKRAPGLKNVLTYPTHTPSHGNSHDPQEEQADLEKHLWPSCPWMESCWRRPRQRTRLVRKCAVMFFFVLSTVSEIPPTIASLRPASLQRQEAHPRPKARAQPSQRRTPT